MCIYIYVCICFLCVCELCLERPHGLLLRKVPCRVERSFAAVLKLVFFNKGLLALGFAVSCRNEIAASACS